MTCVCGFLAVHRSVQGHDLQTCKQEVGDQEQDGVAAGGYGVNPNDNEDKQPEEQYPENGRAEVYFYEIFWSLAKLAGYYRIHPNMANRE